MAFTLAGRTLSRVAVVGSGNIGPDVALYFARILTRHGVPILVHDISQAALNAGRERTLQKLRRGGDSGVFRPLEMGSSSAWSASSRPMRSSRPPPRTSNPT
jgi:3-hydroxyacyl-CoA dehydrogenase